MIYYLILILLFIGVFAEFKEKETSKFLYVTIIIILGFLLCFRFGQGTDYLGYYAQYRNIPTKFSIFIQNHKNFHGEFGWLLMIFTAKRAGLSFEIFNFILSLTMILLIEKSLKKYSPLKNLSLLILFPTYYLTYCFSGIRQGLCLCLFLGIGLDLLFNKKYFRYILLIVLMSMLHRSVLVLLILPFIINFNFEKYEKYLITIPILSLIFSYFGLFNLICKEVFGVNAYLVLSISIPAIIIRIVYYVIIKTLHAKVKKYNNAVERKLYNIYTVGFYIYLGLSFAATLSQRLTMPMKAIEIILIPIQISIMHNNLKNKKIKKNKNKNKKILFDKRILVICASIIMIVPCIEVYKNINSYLKQGDYYEKYNTIDYPYISIFEKTRTCKYMKEVKYNIVKCYGKRQ